MSTTTRCPVCETEIATNDPMESDYRDEEWQAIAVEYDGETYRVCSSDCESAFRDAPADYV